MIVAITGTGLQLLQHTKKVLCFGMHDRSQFARVRLEQPARRRKKVQPRLAKAVELLIKVKAR